ncbi:MAG: oligosaccharide flippase family protein [Anaerolineae bacterium]
MHQFRKLTSKQYQQLGHEFFWIGLGQALATLGSLVGVRLLTGALSPEVYGELALGLTLATLLNQVLLGPLSGAALRFFAPAREANELGAFLTGLRRLLSKATGIVGLAAVVAALALWLAGQIHWLGLGATALGYALLSGYNATLNSLQNAARQRTIVAWHQALYAWAYPLTAMGLVRWLGVSSATAMLGYMSSMALVIISQLWFFRRVTWPVAETARGGSGGRNAWEARLFTYAWPFATWGIFTWAQMSSDRWGLQMFGATQEVGLYAVVYQLGYNPITILTGLMVQLVAPVLFQRAGDASDTERVKQVHIINWRLTMGALLLTGMATLGALGLHRLVFQWLVAPDYREVSWLLPGMVMAGGLFATGQFATISLLSDVKTRHLIAPKIVAALIGVLLNLIGAIGWGITGVVGAGIIANAIYLVWILWLVRKQRLQIQATG